MSYEPRYPEVTVQTTGEDGNALVLIGRVRRALRQVGASQEEITEFSNQATSGDYDKLLRVLQEWVNID